MEPISERRTWIARTGYVGVVLLFAVHLAFWWRVSVLHGFWGHLDEASKRLQSIGLISFLVVLCCLVGAGWRRWVGSILGLLSLVLSFGYAMGL